MLCVFENFLTDSCCEALPSQELSVLLLRLSEQGPRGSSSLPEQLLGLGRLVCTLR